MRAVEDERGPGSGSVTGPGVVSGTESGALPSAAPAGPLSDGGTPDQVVLRRLLTIDERSVLCSYLLVSVVLSSIFLGWLLLPEHLPRPDRGISSWELQGARAAFCLMVLVEVIRMTQSIVVQVFLWHASDPVPLEPTNGLRVALLTTIVPSREPIDAVARSLVALRQVEYEGAVDVWILDEGADPEVRRVAKELGVHYFTRCGQSELNQESGPFKARTKAGNHNSWRVLHERGYDLVGVFDPDHVALPSFLQRTVGYFRDPDVAFVVTPQVYVNMYESVLAHGAACQQWLFNGVIERAGNGLGGPMLTGTNNLYRPSAIEQVGGFRSSVVEDHLTSIHVHAAVNPITGHRWKSVFTPEVLAIGEGPSTWTDYFSQQRRWAYGTCEIVAGRAAWPDGRLALRQRLFYGMLQLYYPSAAAAWLLSHAALALYLLAGTGARLDPLTWLVLWGLSVLHGFSFLAWVRRFYIAPHERQEWGAPGYLLSICAYPTYAAAGLVALLRRPLGFTVTAKGRLRSADSLRTFRLNLGWCAAVCAVAVVTAAAGRDLLPGAVWAVAALSAGLVPPVLALTSGARRSHPKGSGRHVGELHVLGRTGPADLARTSLGDQAHGGGPPVEQHGEVAVPPECEDLLRAFRVLPEQDRRASGVHVASQRGAVPPGAADP